MATVAAGSTLYDYSVRTIAGKLVSLAAYRDRVCLIVNVASECGFTPQYAGLEELYRRFRDRGFVVLGFPCNQFGHQEPGDEGAIQEFCRLNYSVTFPLFAKIDRGEDRGLVWLAGVDPTVHSRPNFSRPHPT